MRREIPLMGRHAVYLKREKKYLKSHQFLLFSQGKFQWTYKGMLPDCIFIFTERQNHFSAAYLKNQQQIHNKSRLNHHHQSFY